MKLISVLFSLLLVGCVTKPVPAPVPPVGAPLNIYQASVLKIKAGTVIETVDGIYTAQTDEVWHSDKRFREQERRGY
jgi:hypothetical protein